MTFLFLQKFHARSQMLFELLLSTFQRIFGTFYRGNIRKSPVIRSIFIRSIKMFGVHLVLSCNEEVKTIVNNGKCWSQSSFRSLTNIACCKVLLKRSIIPSDFGWMGVALHTFVCKDLTRICALDLYGFLTASHIGILIHIRIVSDSLYRVVWKSLCLCPLC